MVALVWVGLASTFVALVALSTGALLLRRGAVGRGSLHPYGSAALCGLLIGIAMLVVLPGAMNKLTVEGQWSTEQAVIVFLLSMVSTHPSGKTYQVSNRPQTTTVRSRACATHGRSCARWVRFFSTTSC